MKLLTTDYLTLCPLKSEDIEPLCEILGNSEVTKYLFKGGSPLSNSDARDFISENFSPETEPIGLGVLLENSTGQVIGYAGLQHCPYLGTDDLEFGFVLAESHWGNEHALEIGLRQIEYGLNDLKYPRLLALTDPANERSRAVLERKLKMRLLYEVPIDIQDRGLRLVYCLEQDKH